MSTAPPKTTGYVSGEDPDTIEANRVYQDALARLSQSLDTRKNRFFDPVWLAAAQGFGAPTQTGGFGESLSNAAKSISAAQAEDIKQQQEIDQQRVAAAGKGVELQRMRAKDADIAKWLQGDQSGPIAGPQAGPLAGPLSAAVAGSRAASPVGGPLTTSVPTAPEPAVPDVASAAPVRPPSVVQPSPLAPITTAQVALPSNAEDDGGVQIFPENRNFMTAREYVSLNRNSGKPLGELIKEGMELERKNLEVKESGTTNLRTGRFYASNAEPVDIRIFAEGYNGGTFTVPKSVALQLSVLQRQGNEAGYKALADKFTGRTFGRPAGAAPVAGGAVPVGKAPASVGSGSNEDRAKAAARTKALAEADTAIEVENRKDFATRGKDSSEMLATANVMRSFTADPNFNKMTGILSNDKISSGIGLLFRDGIGGKNFSIGIPAIEDIMRNAGLTKEQQATYRTFLMYATQMQLNAEKAMKGATSQPERLILGSANISPQDTAESVRRKADLLTTKGQFDRQAARAFKASKMTAEEFLDSDQYMGMYDKYFADISGIATGLKAYQNPAAAAPAGAQPTGTQPARTPPVSDPIKAARDRVRQELNKK